MKRPESKDKTLILQRAQNLKTSRDALIIEIAGVRRNYSIPTEHIKASQIKAFANALKVKLLAKDSTISKNYLSLLVDKIVVNENTATVTGKYSALAHVATLIDKKIGHLNQVPASISEWGG